MLALYDAERARLRRDPAAVKKLVLGTKPLPGTNAIELAALTVVANTVLNLDEALTKE
jgi:hypothetical protein